MRKTYKGHITELKDNEIFVFGSNTEGRHGKGAALVARKQFGAVYGQASGLQNRSYAIITKDLRKSTHPSIPVSNIEIQIGFLYNLVRKKPDWLFYVAYSGKGVNLNSYTPQEMAEMFASHEIPDNVVFEERFSELVDIFK